MSSEHVIEINDPVSIVSNLYIERLTQMGIVATQDIEGSCDHPHLLWMLETLTKDVGMSYSKRNRWLGFVQACLIKDGVLNLQRERADTRDIFNGD